MVKLFFPEILHHFPEKLKKIYEFSFFQKSIKLSMSADKFSFQCFKNETDWLINKRDFAILITRVNLALSGAP